MLGATSAQSASTTHDSPSSGPPKHCKTPPVTLPSSQASPADSTPSPHSGVMSTQASPGVGQLQLSSTSEQSSAQPSPLIGASQKLPGQSASTAHGSATLTPPSQTPPSSQASPACWMPSPQRGAGTQALPGAPQT